MPPVVAGHSALPSPHPNRVAHVALTLVFVAISLCLTLGLERDPAWAAFLLGTLLLACALAFGAGHDVARYGDRFSFAVCLSAGMQLLRASQRDTSAGALAAAFVPLAIALHILQRRPALGRLVRYLLLIIVPTLAGQTFVAGHRALAIAWAALAVALAV